MLNARKISIIHVGGFRPTGNLYASHFGLTPLALPEERWPTYFSSPDLSSGIKDQEAKNLFFICQLNLTEAPYVPEILSDIKLITIFSTPDFVYSDNTCIRTYKNLKGLVPLHVPNGSTFAKGFEVSYELAYDYPLSGNPDLELSEGAEDLTPEFDQVTDKFVHKTCSKIGGYASDIQYEPFDEYINHPAKPKFCLQIDSEQKIRLMWGDSGSLYIARGTAEGYEDKWFFEIQFF